MPMLAIGLHFYSWATMSETMKWCWNKQTLGQTNGTSKCQAMASSNAHESLTHKCPSGFGQVQTAMEACWPSPKDTVALVATMVWLQHLDVATPQTNAAKCTWAISLSMQCWAGGRVDTVFVQQQQEDSQPFSGKLTEIFEETAKDIEACLKTPLPPSPSTSCTSTPHSCSTSCSCSKPPALPEMSRHVVCILYSYYFQLDFSVPLHLLCFDLQISMVYLNLYKTDIKALDSTNPVLLCMMHCTDSPSWVNINAGHRQHIHGSRQHGIQ